MPKVAPKSQKNNLIRQSVELMMDQADKMNCDQFPESMKTLLDVRSKLGGLLEQFDAESSELWQDIERLLNDLALKILEKNELEIPEELRSTYEIITLLRRKLPGVKRIGRPRGSKDKPSSSAIKPENVKTAGVAIKSILRSVDKKDLRKKSVKALPEDVKIQLMSRPFVRLAKKLKCSPEDCMDNKVHRKEVAEALSTALKIDARSASSFYAHSAEGFRNKENSMWNRFNA